MKSFVTELKLGVTAAFAVLTAWLGVLATPVYILVLLNVCDYLTGLAAAPNRHQRRSSAKGLQGIVKKVCMWVLVGMGVAVDWLLLYAAQSIGLEPPFHFLVGAAVAIWLVCNEIVSILENIGDIGVQVPTFLRSLIEWVQRTTEEKTDL